MQIKAIKVQRCNQMNFVVNPLFFNNFVYLQYDKKRKEVLYESK